MMSTLLEGYSRLDRLREVVEMIKRGEKFSAFDLAVKFDVSLGVVYRDIASLRKEKLIPADWKFAERKEQSGSATK